MVVVLVERTRGGARLVAEVKGRHSCLACVQEESWFQLQ